MKINRVIGLFLLSCVVDGLPPTDEFWSAPFTGWTNLKAWNGEKVQADHAIE